MGPIRNSFLPNGPSLTGSYAGSMGSAGPASSTSPTIGIGTQYKYRKHQNGMSFANGMFHYVDGIGISELFDGTSNTIMLGETVEAQRWPVKYLVQRQSLYFQPAFNSHANEPPA